MVRTHAAEVSNADMESHSCTSLIATSQVVGKPTNNAGERWVDPASREKDAAVDYARVLSRVHRNTPVKLKVVSIFVLRRSVEKKKRGGRCSHRKPNQHNREEPKNEWATLSGFIRKVGKYHRQDGRGDVDRHRHELRLTGRVP